MLLYESNLSKGVALFEFVGSIEELLEQGKDLRTAVSETKTKFLQPSASEGMSKYDVLCVNQNPARAVANTLHSTLSSFFTGNSSNILPSNTQTLIELPLLRPAPIVAQQTTATPGLKLTNTNDG